MPSDNNNHSATALDFATHTVFGDKVTDTEKDEVIDTLRELITYFGKPAIVRACLDLEVFSTVSQHIKADGTSKAITQEMQDLTAMQHLRAFVVLVLESPRPLLTVQLVGKLVGLEITTGKRIKLSELAAAEGITKQAVSKYLATYAKRLNLPRPDSTAEARTAHRLMNRRNLSWPDPIQTC